MATYLELKVVLTPDLHHFTRKG